MTIWLGYPDEATSDDSGEDTVQNLIDEIQALDDEISQLEDQLVVELEGSDTKLKRTEKEEFVDLSEFGDDGITVSDDTTWSEIIEAYNKKWRTESGAKRDSLEEKLKWLRTVMDKKWSYGDIKIPHGKIAVDMDERIANGYTGEVKTKIGELSDNILELNNKMVELVEALEQERSGGGGGGKSGGNANQDILEVVRSMKAVTINTVTNVVTDDNRWFVEHQVPGRSGVDSEVSASIIQDLGRQPAKVSFKGILTSEKENREDLHKKIETLKWFYKQRKPLFFSSSFVNKFESTKVVIEKINFEETSESPYAVPFKCLLKEYNDVDWSKSADDSEILARQRQHWANYQALNAMVDYRSRYIEPDETASATLVGNRLAKFLIGMNGKLKHLAAVGRLIESPDELGTVLGEISVTNLSWNQDVARRGDTLELTADVSGAPDDTSASIEIWEYDDDGSHDLIKTISATVKDNKISYPWDYEYHEDVDEAPTAEESEKGYNPPEYFFTVEINGQKFGEAQESKLLEFKDFVEFTLKDPDGNPFANEDYIMTLPDGTKREGKLDADGHTRIEDVPPGEYKVILPNV